MTNSLIEALERAKNLPEKQRAEIAIHLYRAQVLRCALSCSELMPPQASIALINAAYEHVPEVSPVQPSRNK